MNNYSIQKFKKKTINLMINILYIYFISSRLCIVCSNMKFTSIWNWRLKKCQIKKHLYSNNKKIR